MASIFDYRQAAPGYSFRDPSSGTRPAPGFSIGDRARPGRSLSALIESEIIPRLMVAHPTRPASDDRPGGARVSEDDIVAFSRLALQVEADDLLGRVEALLDGGISVETLLVDLLGPAARKLGEYWEDDTCDFVDVTMGLWRLQEVVHECVARSPAARAAAGGRRALFAPMPGEQHGFGTLVIAELFAREGWSVERLGDGTQRDITARVATDWFDLVGLTVSCDCNTGALPSLIAGLRSVSRNPGLRVMVGGRVFVADPAMAEAVGADGTAADARVALALADSLVVSAAREAIACG